MEHAGLLYEQPSSTVIVHASTSLVACRQCCLYYYACIRGRTVRGSSMHVHAVRVRILLPPH
eukprot:1051883-Pleurochrysis_carterae.AAC.1